MAPEFSLYLASICFFHASEYVFAALFHPERVSSRSFLISRAYVTAMAAGFLEYGLERYLFLTLHSKCPGVDCSAIVQATSWLGMAMIIVGELIRKAGMLTAQRNFTHDVQIYRRNDHVLVTGGIYRWMRHPAYCGWLIWSVGTQVLLVNPVCIIAFTFAAWRFFKLRITYEDRLLQSFFGDEYLQYRRRTPSGLPLID